MDESIAGSEQRHAAIARFRVPGLRWWIAVLLMGVTIVNYLDRTCLSVAAPTLKSRLGINEVDFSNILLAFQFTYLVMQPLIGRIIDVLDLRVGLAASILWWSLAQGLTAFAGGWRTFAVFRALLGIGEAANFPSGAKAVSQWFPPRERTVATGIFNVGAGLGQAIAAPLVVYLIMRHGWQAAFVLTGIVGILWLPLWLLVYRPPEVHPWLSPAELGRIKEGRQDLPVGDDEPQRGVWRIVLAQKNFWAFAIARFFSEPAWAFFTYWIPLYLVTERHMRLVEIGAFAWLPFVAGDLGCIFGGVLSPLFVRLRCSILTARKMAASVCALLMVVSVSIGSVPTSAAAIALFCVAAFAHQAMSSTLLTLPADLFPTRAVATANGLSGMAGYLGALLFTKAIGIVVVRVGYSPLFASIACFDGIGVAFLWGLMRDPQRGGALPR